MNALKTALTAIGAALFMTAGCVVVMVGLPLGIAWLTDDGRPRPTPQERRDAEFIWRAARELDAWHDLQLRQAEDLIIWQDWLAREPGIDEPRGMWVAWLEAEPRVVADPFSLIENEPPTRQ